MQWKGTMQLYCDNKLAINIKYIHVQHDCTKHVKVDRHLVKNKLDSGLVSTPYVSTGGQLADILTKRLTSQAFHMIMSILGMDNVYSLA